MLIPKRINNVFLDYEKGVLKINGEKVDIPVVVVLRQSDGWDNKKLFNSEVFGIKEAIPGLILNPAPELILDATSIAEYEAKEELKNVIQGVIKECMDNHPAKP